MNSFALTAKTDDLVCTYDVDKAVAAQSYQVNVY